jgi:hypothetical protein
LLTHVGKLLVFPTTCCIIAALSKGTKRRCLPTSAQQSTATECSSGRCLVQLGQNAQHLVDFILAHSGERVNDLFVIHLFE